MYTQLFQVLAPVFMAALFAFMAVYLLLFGKQLEMSKRVEEVVGRHRPTIREKELSEPFMKRVFRPFLQKLVRVASRMLPSEKEAVISRKITMAGRPGGLGPREFMAIKLMLAVCGPALAVLADSLLSLKTGNLLAVSAAAAAGGWILPDIYLRRQTDERKNEVEKTLPDVLDLITVSMEAGMGFDGAIMKVAEKSKGPLPQEFLIVLQECKMGKSRKDALRDMADRVDVDDLSTFVGSVIMADQLGISLSNIMRLQSEEVRRKRRQRAEEKAMKAPVKMLIPMVTCIFPAIFVVLLGPAAINIYQALVL
ncbi:MAG: type II secretion system F family protein [Peptococcaceae bacterium]|nr:type II secretion system F family protein [Peptococcaceae bacterium]